MSDSFPEKYRYDIQIIRETAHQIERDLKVDGFELIISSNLENAFIDIKSQLVPVMSKIISGDKSSFQTLLYRIDISEKDYKKILTDNDSTQFLEKLSELIIRREFQKVITRKYFSNH
jgi:hypothetical protein